MDKKRLFLASSAELSQDRKEFEIFIYRKNKDWVDKGVFLELVVGEDFLDAVSKTRLQDEYDKAIRDCDLFVMLFSTKVGRYTEEEFETAFGPFKATRKPFLFTYFKDVETTGNANQQDLVSLRAFQQKLDTLGHFYSRYRNTDQLKFHFAQQLDTLVASGFIEFRPDKGEAGAPGGTSYQATLTGSGAIAQGPGATAVGARGVYVGGKSTGNINTGNQTTIDTGGGAYIRGSVDTGGGDFIGRDKATQGVSARDLEPLFAPLFAPLLAAVAQHGSADRPVAALQQVQALKAELAKGKQADDTKLGKLVDDLASMVPGAIAAVVNLFAQPILGDVAGPVTKFVLDKLKFD